MNFLSAATMYSSITFLSGVSVCRWIPGEADISVTRQELENTVGSPA